jgi:23S rRNA pseudouridine1911/1915/1917 synthase
MALGWIIAFLARPSFKTNSDESLDAEFSTANGNPTVVTHECGVKARLSKTALLTVLYLDNHLLVVRKPAGMLVQGDDTGDASLLELARAYLKARFDKPGNVFLGLVHRLDRPVSGVVVLARTSKAAARLSRQFSTRQTTKIYWALVAGRPPDNGRLSDRIVRNGPNSRIGDGACGQTAELRYQRLRYHDGISLLKVELVTGRHHQIRVQFASRGFPVLGDFRYGSKTTFPNRSIALHAHELTFTHPVRQESMTFQADPEPFWPVDLMPTDR